MLYVNKKELIKNKIKTIKWAQNYNKFHYNIFAIQQKYKLRALDLLHTGERKRRTSNYGQKHQNI